MVILLPYPSLPHSLAVLDDETLRSQVELCRRIASELRGEITYERTEATAAWRPYTRALNLHYCLACLEQEYRGDYSARSTTINSRSEPFSRGVDDCRLGGTELPPWTRDPALHAAHRAYLLHHAPEHYGRLGWAEAPCPELMQRVA